MTTNEILLLWALCSMVTVFICILLMRDAKDKDVFTNYFGWMMICLTPISMAICGVFLFGWFIYMVLDFIPNRLFKLCKPEAK